VLLVLVVVLQKQLTQAPALWVVVLVLPLLAVAH
jgi:hypothetical protein